MSTSFRFLQPLDVLFLRGNHLFGDTGQHGAALMPPWPSVAAGALRSRMLADAGVDLEKFKAEKRPDGALGDALGTPAQPGHFELAGVWLARSGAGGIERFHPAPADVVMLDGQLHRLHPCTLPLPSSANLPQVPVLRSAKVAKPETDWVLNEDGWRAWLADGALDASRHSERTNKLYAVDERLGIALDGASRTAADSALYTTQAVAMKPEAGFLCAVRGVADELLPGSGLIRFGGDGRGAAISAVALHPTSPPEGSFRKFKLILTTPGIFDGGWQLPGLNEENVWHGPDGCTARLVCAAVPRAETVSGWDLANGIPKPARRAAPTGSVYWFEDFQGSPEVLRKLAETGLWEMPNQNTDPQRRAEGFNRCAIGTW